MKILPIILFVLPTVIIGNKIETRIRSKWKQTSIIAEMSEYFDDEVLFWKFVDSVNSENLENSDNWTDKEKYDFAIKHASKFIDNGEIGIIKIFLSTRKMSPRVQVHQTISVDKKPDACDVFYSYNGHNSCKFAEVKEFLKEKSRISVLPIDHVYPNRNNMKNETIFEIYGELGTRNLQKAIEDAKQFVSSGNNIRFILRHFSKPRDSEFVSISGYGVELALKNTEYKAHGDKNDDWVPENLHGIDFKALISKYEDLRLNIESLRDHLEKIGEIVPLKQWQLNSLGVKSCKYILEKANNSMDFIEETVQNFPSYARLISHRNLENDVEKLIEINHHILESHEIYDGRNGLYLNGKLINNLVETEEHLDLFSIIDSLKNEIGFMKKLTKFGISFKSVPELFSNIHFEPDSQRKLAIDYRKASPIFINNVEDFLSPYKSLSLILKTYAPNEIRPISRNIFNLILICDPFDETDTLYYNAMKVLRRHYFIRVGVIFVHNTTDKLQIKSVRNDFRDFIDESNLKEIIENGNQFLREAGLLKYPHALLNGFILDLNSKPFESTVMEEINRQTSILQSAVSHKTITDEDNIADWWLERDGVMKRVHYKIYEAIINPKFVSKKFVELVSDVKYFMKDTNKNAAITTLVISSFEGALSRQFVLEALKTAEDGEKVGILLNPSSDSLQNRHVAHFLDKLHPDQWIEEFEKMDKMTENVDVKSSSSWYKSHLSAISEIIPPGKSAVISNGMFIGPLDDFELFNGDDFGLLVKYWRDKNIEKLVDLFNQSNENGVMKFFSEFGNDLKSGKRMDFTALSSTGGTVNIPGNNPGYMDVALTWIANPLSLQAQQIASIVKLIGGVTNAHIEIIFNPPKVLTELPINRFYRFVVNPEMEFDKDGKIVDNVAIFDNVPKKQLLTMSIHTNDAWLVELVEGKYDMDNVLMELISEDVLATYSLEHILVEGQCLKSDDTPANSLEIHIKSRNEVYDTIVMRNLGYLQLKASPGIWNLNLQGEMAISYQMSKINGNEMSDHTIIIDSFTGKWIKIEVEEKENEEEEKENEEEEKEEEVEGLDVSFSGLANVIGSYFFPSNSEKYINIFSLASGHVYERFLRIMMLSVMKTTKESRVKFWLLKNYLSPKFKNMLPKMAEKYGFDYALIEYKWPKWLKRQKEKQRVMWGYKILFLDVLFPLNVDKIIFVDADQVVRADMQELMDLPLDGAPYGYVPFCDSREEMEGFRFWKSGYWHEYLMGRKYHISALYVVDLKNFRAISAGDRLRESYQVLSSDRDSLSNLDQDLPNHLIHRVPIKSLPQEWLWCETWCDDASKETAKTIDLCNNPLTKEPKMKAAVRIIQEWNDYDQEIAKIGSGDTSEL